MTVKYQTQCTSITLLQRQTSYHCNMTMKIWSATGEKEISKRLITHTHTRTLALTHVRTHAHTHTHTHTRHAPPPPPHTHKRTRRASTYPHTRALTHTHAHYTHTHTHTTKATPILREGCMAKLRDITAPALFPWVVDGLRSIRNIGQRTTHNGQFLRIFMREETPGHSSNPNWERGQYWPGVILTELGHSGSWHRLLWILLHFPIMLLRSFWRIWVNHSLVWFFPLSVIAQQWLSVKEYFVVILGMIKRKW